MVTREGLGAAGAEQRLKELAAIKLSALLQPFGTYLEAVRTGTRHVGVDHNVEHYDPAFWTDEFSFLNQRSQADIQSEIPYHHRASVDACPKWQAWLRDKQMQGLVLWGKSDLSFDYSEPEAYHRDLPQAEVHVLDSAISHWTRPRSRSQFSSVSSSNSELTAIHSAIGIT